VSSQPAEPPSDEPTPTASTSLGDARTLRPGSSVAAGIVGALAGLALLVPALLTSPRSWSLISGVTLALVLLWLFVVRPCARIHTEGVRLVNPLRTVDLTWPAISEVRSRWALELVSDGRRYTAWGVPADPGRPRYGRGMLTIGTDKLGRLTTEKLGPTKRPKIEAQGVAREIEERIAADRRRKHGRTPRIAVRSWDPLAVGLLLGATAFWVIAVLVA
jgi:hypothetical protein